MSSMKRVPLNIIANCILPLLGIAAAAAVTPGCEIVSMASGSVRGSGVMASESRDVPPFTRIDLRGSADVVVTVGSEQSVKVETDDNLLPHVTTAVENGTLVISDRGSINTHLPMKVTVSAPALEGASIAGSGDIRVAGVKSPSFEASIAGSGSVTATGEAEKVSVSIAGSGDVSLFDLAARKGSVSIAGSGDAEVNVTESLWASVMGSGDVLYKGNPADVQRSQLGSGSIRAAD